jgi:hypothetical protein
MSSKLTAGFIGTSSVIGSDVEAGALALFPSLAGGFFRGFVG